MVRLTTDYEFDLVKWRRGKPFVRKIFFCSSDEFFVRRRCGRSDGAGTEEVVCSDERTYPYTVHKYRVIGGHFYLLDHAEYKTFETARAAERRAPIALFRPGAPRGSS